jgi:hypothetical protein
MIFPGGKSIAMLEEQLEVTSLPSYLDNLTGCKNSTTHSSYVQYVPRLQIQPPRQHTFASQPSLVVHSTVGQLLNSVFICMRSNTVGSVAARPAGTPALLRHSSVS